MTETDRPPSLARIVVVDDEPLVLKAWERALAKDHRVTTFADPLVAKRFFETDTVDVAIFDLQMPGLDGLSLLRHVREVQPDVETIMMSGLGTVPDAVEAMRLGAYDFFTKPILDIAAAVRRIDTAVERRRLRVINRQLQSKGGTTEDGMMMIGDSQPMRTLREFIARIADSNAPVLIRGETGTGKELVARAIHARSPRQDKPFVAVNCAGITETLIDSELFGHERGAFTGAQSGHKGLFEAADGGVLFLDEIGDMPAQTQVRLLRTLQEGEVRPVGSTKTRKVDVRVVSATNVDLEQAVRDGGFREDLFYRLSAVRVDVPPLRERRADVSLLAHHLISVIDPNKECLSTDALQALIGHDWRGNVRELRNVLEHACAVAADAEIQKSDLPGNLAKAQTRSVTLDNGADMASDLSYAQLRNEAIRAFEHSYLTRLLSATGGNVSEAARRSGIDRSNLRRMMRRHGMAPEMFQ